MDVTAPAPTTRDGRPVTIVLLDDMTQIAASSALMDEIWQTENVMPSNMSRAIQHAGGYLAGAFVDGEMIGTSVGFIGRHGGATILHSHITGVHPSHRGIGAALKHHQRRWCADRGIVAITWTFDPLVARNAYFNLHKLGASCREYLVDHYGPLHDGINAGAASDRLLAWWPTVPAPVQHTQPERAVQLLGVGDDGAPEFLAVTSSHPGKPLALRIPGDIEGLRVADPAMADLWRAALRDAMAPAMKAGYVVTDMTRDGTYLLTCDHPTSEHP